MTVKIPLNYQSLETQDGSFTLFSERFQEACHSTAGAKAETVLHYVNGCKILEREGHVEILEVGFGTGLGFLTTLELMKEKTQSWHFTSLELDQNLVEFFFDQNQSLFHSIDRSETRAHATLGNAQLSILIGDARTVLPEYVAPKWNAIYQDAFSPKKNPDLWTVEWFRLLRERSAADVIMSTYSASSSIRKSMVEAGWKLYAGEKFGPKRTSTRARLSGETDADILLSLSRSPTPALTDAQIRATITS